jgi:hypothetical protein
MRPEGVVSDGPYIESKEIVGGYSIVQADDYEGAMAVAKECPILEPGGGGSVEIRQLAEYT